MKKIFVSHIHEEAPIAVILKEWIETTFAGHCEVFVSSDLSDIPAGSRWLEEIDKALSSSVTFLVLCSPASLSRPWINFETGCGWIKRIPIIPICYPGLKKDSLPTPISMFQAVEIESKDFVSTLFKSIAKHLNIPKVPRIANEEMVREIAYAFKSLSQNREEATTCVQDSGDASSIDQFAIKVLHEVAEGGNHGDPTWALAYIFSVSEQRMQYYLDMLVEHGLLDEERYRNTSYYTLAKKGRKYLGEKGLL